MGKNLSIQNLLESGMLWTKADDVNSCHLISPNSSLKFGIPEIDSCLPCGGLSLGALHEFALDDGLSNRQSYYWHPPLILIAAILSNSNVLQTVWVGEKCWASPKLFNDFLGDKSTQNFIFCSPSSSDKRFWTIARILFSKSSFLVIADGSKLGTLGTKRLSLAARQSGNVCLILRPPWEIEQTSTAQTKWKLTPVYSKCSYMKWRLTLLKSKGTLRYCSSLYPKTWLIQWNKKDAKNIISLSS